MVDIDQTLLGIDRLLKFQQLTLAFSSCVGNCLRRRQDDIRSVEGRKRKKGGKRRRREGWEGVRRIERLLITQGGQQRTANRNPSPLLDMINDDAEDARSTGLFLPFFLYPVFKLMHQDTYSTSVFGRFGRFSGSTVG